MMTMTLKLGLDEANIVRDALAFYRDNLALTVAQEDAKEDDRIQASRTVYTIEVIERQMGVSR